MENEIEQPRPCPVCGEPIPRRPPSQALKYCSRKCSGVAKTTLPTDLVCKACGESFTPKTRYQAARNVSCSPHCAKSLVGRANSGRPSPRNRKITVSCSVCQETFELSPSRVARVDTPSCSRKCNGVLRGRDWGVLGSLGAAARTPESYAVVAAKMAGPRNPSWKGGVTYKRPKGNYVGPRYVRCPEKWRGMARADGYIMEHRLVMAVRLGRLLHRHEVVNHINHDPRDNRLENLELYPSNGDHKRGEAGRFVSGVANSLFFEAHESSPSHPSLVLRYEMKDFSGPAVPVAS
jgi:endogenous inhibitor of DNA gyrase (YacG/DUF329 family)